MFLIIAFGTPPLKHMDGAENSAPLWGEELCGLAWVGFLSDRKLGYRAQSNVGATGEKDLLEKRRSW